MCHLIDHSITPSDDIQHVNDWLTEPPAELRPDSTDREVWDLSDRVIVEAADRGLPLTGGSIVAILMWMRSDLSRSAWRHVFECRACSEGGEMCGCGMRDACRVSCLAPTSDRWYTMGDPECPWRRTNANGEDRAVWKYLGALPVPFVGGEA